MYATGLKCVNCGTIFPLKTEFFVCPKCGVEKINGISIFLGITEVQYDYEAIANIVSKELFTKRPFNLWRYRELLGFGKEDTVVTLGEGGTPLIKCRKLAEELGLKKLWLKNEAQNPTNSFKDRESALAATKALQLGAQHVSCVSSGNAASSLAAYAARAGLNCFVLMPATASKAKICQSAVFGAKTLLIDGSYEEIFELYIEALKGLDIFDCSSGRNRFRPEGDKTIAYEICEQFEWGSPAWIVDNVGNGTHLYGMWKGFKEFRNLGLIEDLPRMVAIGPIGGAPIVKGFKEGTALPEAVGGESIAEGLMSIWSYDAPLALKALRESNGHAEYVTDTEIIEAMRLLARFEGIFAEPSGAACVAGLLKIVKAGIVDQGDEVVCLITGSGLKDLASGKRISNKPIRIEAKIKEMKRALRTFSYCK
jgi:threonine synthase